MTRAKPKTGRPLLDDPRTVRYTLRLTPREYEAMERSAHAAGMSVAGWARKRLAGRSIRRK